MSKLLAIINVNFGDLLEGSDGKTNHFGPLIDKVIELASSIFSILSIVIIGACLIDIIIGGAMLANSGDSRERTEKAKSMIAGGIIAAVLYGLASAIFLLVTGVHL